MLSRYPTSLGRGHTLDSQSKINFPLNHCSAMWAGSASSTASHEVLVKPKINKQIYATPLLM